MNPMKIDNFSISKHRHPFLVIVSICFFKKRFCDDFIGTCSGVVGLPSKHTHTDMQTHSPNHTNAPFPDTYAQTWIY